MGTSMATSICPEPTISLSVFSVQDAIQYGMGHQWRRHADRLAGRIRRSFRAKSRRHQPGRQLGSISGRKEKKTFEPRLLCFVNLSINGIVQIVSLSLLFLDFGFGSLRRQNSGQKPKRRTPLRSGPRRRSFHTKQGYSPSTLRRFNFSRKKSVRQSQRLHV